MKDHKHKWMVSYNENCEIYAFCADPDYECSIQSVDDLSELGRELVRLGDQELCSAEMSMKEILIAIGREGARYRHQDINNKWCVFLDDVLYRAVDIEQILNRKGIK